MQTNIFPWSRAQHTKLGQYAIDRMINLDLPYHNLEHLAYMYSYLENSYTYSEELDYAILFHDTVYDEFPSKEQRSAVFWFEAADRIDKTMSANTKRVVSELIMATENHLVTNPILGPIIRADLSAFSDSTALYYNHFKLMKESRAIYGLSEQEIAKASTTFLEKLKLTAIKNITLDYNYNHFWESVVGGINKAMLMNAVLL